MQAQREGDFTDNFIHPISKGSHIPITYLAALLTVGQTLTICPKPSSNLHDRSHGVLFSITSIQGNLFVLFITGHHKLINNYFI
jgi:hypothetical protein